MIPAPNIIKRIEEFSDIDLIQEISRRFDDVVFAGRKVGLGGIGKCQRRRFWKGDYDACVGLVMGTAQDCMNKTWGVDPGDISNG